ncbi:MAG: hypothetical protein J6T10_00890 [Methanobrevibacter sp.]|nr:hypothetical protein [Methanobrevibacter sp.]
MEINNKYNLNDTVFVFTGKNIVKATIIGIDASIRHNKIDFDYYLNADSDYAQEQLDVCYKEEELSPSIEDIVNHIEVL